MLTILSGDMGVISACAYGVRSSKSKLKAATQILCYGDFVLSKKGGEIWRVDSVEILESFYPICEDFEKLALAGYLLELCRDAMADSDQNVLALLLNTLYVVAYKAADPDFVKAVFELKLMQYSGYEPQMDRCMVCGNHDAEHFAFDSGVVCADCKTASVKLLSGTICAMRYVLGADTKKLFSFEVSENVKKQLEGVCEKYLLLQTEKNYKSLEYYKKIKGM